MHRNQHNYDKMKLEIQKILLAFALPLLLLFILYTLRTMESVMNWDFITWGIYPKETKGIMGILTSPLIHADWGPLFANQSFRLMKSKGPEGMKKAITR